MQKRFYILFVARGDDGQLRKISIPVQYLYIFVVGAAIGFLSLTGIASSYARMLFKVSRYNELRTEKEQLKDRYSRLEQVAKERDVQVASLGSIANEVSALYGLKSQPTLVTASQEQIQDAEVTSSLDQLHALRSSALSGAATVGITLGLTRNATTADWFRANSAPNLWPVEGQVTGSFGERIDPFNGEGAFHSGVDISSNYGHQVIAPADAVVTFTTETVPPEEANSVVLNYAEKANAHRLVTRVLDEYKKGGKVTTRLHPNVTRMLDPETQRLLDQVSAGGAISAEEVKTIGNRTRKLTQKLEG